MSDWIGVPDNIEDYQGFVYIITNLLNNKFYIGQKSFWKIDKRPILKNALSKAVQDKIIKLENKYKLGKIKTKKELKAKIVELKKLERDRRSKLKGNKRLIKVQTDWRAYFGSSEALKSDVESLGKDNFRREIIWLCTGRWWLSFLELKEQIESNAIFRDDSYNLIINVRLSGNFIKSDDFKKQKLVFKPRYY